MKNFLIILIATLFITVTTKAQNLFFIGESSYPCTETITLQSNSDFNDLNVLFAKDKTTVLVALSIESPFFDSTFGEKIIVYLDDGTVITCIDKAKHDFIDGKALAVYNLANEQLSKMITSNLNTVRFGLKFDLGSLSPEERYFTASNKGINKTDVPTLLIELIEGKKRPLTNLTDVHTNTTGEGFVVGQGNQGIPSGSIEPQVRGEGSGTGDGGISYDLAGRKILSLNRPTFDSQKTGIVVVGITVDRNGRVTEATPGIKGSTTLDEYLLIVSREAAFQARFEPKPDAPLIQKGTITYNFTLR
ncbi:MAG: energy transducer TonB [Bacteroidales bacterium]